MYWFRFTNAANWLTYASIVDESMVYYQTTNDGVVWFGNTYFITYIVLSYFGSWMTYKYFKYSMLSGTFCGALGCWIRYASKKNYAGAMVGEELNALAQIWVLETPIGSFLLESYFLNLNSDRGDLVSQKRKIFGYFPWNFLKLSRKWGHLYFLSSSCW